MQTARHRAYGWGFSSTFAAAGAALLPAQSLAQSERVPTFRQAMVIPSHSGSTWAGRPYGIATADFLDSTGMAGQDGYPEVVVVNSGIDLLSCSPASWGQIDVFWNTGEWGTGIAGLELVQEIPISPGLGAEIAIADLDGVNGPDLVVSATQWVHGWQNAGLYVALNDGSGAFLDAAKHSMPLGLLGLCVTDVDGNGLGGDVVAATTDCPRPDGVPLDFLWVKMGSGDGRFLDQVPVQVGITNHLAPAGLAPGDFFEGSGPVLPDFVVPCGSADLFWTVENLGGGEFRARAARKPGNCQEWWGMTRVASGRINSDDHDDFLGVSGLDALIFLGDGRGEFVSSCDDARLRCALRQDDEAPPTFAHGLAVGHLNGGTRLDVAVAIRNDVIDRPEVAVLLGRADGTMQTPSPTHAYLYSLDGDPADPTDVSGPVMVAIVDLDANGLGDIVTTNHYSDTLSILMGTARSTSP